MPAPRSVLPAAASGMLCVSARALPRVAKAAVALAPAMAMAPARALSVSARVPAALKVPGEESLVRNKAVGNTLTATLNRPKALNALNLEMVTLLREQLDRFLASTTAGIFVLNHEGRAFCSGGDVLAVVKAAKSDEPSVRGQALRFFQKEYELDYALARLGQYSQRAAVANLPHDKTAVALLDGITMGGGVGLSSHIPFRVVTDKTLWAMPETGIGFFPDVGVARNLARLDGGVGLYLALTGARLQGWEVYYLGLGTHYVRSSAITRVHEALELTQQEPPTTPTQREPPSISARVHDVLEDYSIDPLDPANEEVGADAMDKSAFFGPRRVAMDYVFGAHTYPKFGVGHIYTALEELYAPEPWASAAGKALVSGEYGHFAPTSAAWSAIAEWAKETHIVLNTKSPRSLVVTHRHIAEAAGPLRLPQSFDVDMRRCTAFCDLAAPPAGQNEDFYTGVTHVLEKDPATGKRRTGPPAWNPPSLDKVDTRDVAALFFSSGHEAAAAGMTLKVPQLQLVTPRSPEGKPKRAGSWRLTPAEDGDFAIPDALGPLGWAPTHNPFALPSEAECAALLAGEHPGAVAGEPTASELADALSAFHGPKPGLKRKVFEWAERMTEPQT